jgi:hypothetical protein
VLDRLRRPLGGLRKQAFDVRILRPRTDVSANSFNPGARRRPASRTGEIGSSKTCAGSAAWQEFRKLRPMRCAVCSQR